MSAGYLDSILNAMTRTAQGLIVNPSASLSPGDLYETSTSTAGFQSEVNLEANRRRDREVDEQLRVQIQKRCLEQQEQQNRKAKEANDRKEEILRKGTSQDKARYEREGVFVVPPLPKSKVPWRFELTQNDRMMVIPILNVKGQTINWGVPGNEKGRLSTEEYFGHLMHHDRYHTATQCRKLAKLHSEQHKAGESLFQLMKRMQPWMVCCYDCPAQLHEEGQPPQGCHAQKAADLLNARVRAHTSDDPHVSAEKEDASDNTDNSNENATAYNNNKKEVPTKKRKGDANEEEKGDEMSQQSPKRCKHGSNHSPLHIPSSPSSPAAASPPVSPAAASPSATTAVAAS